MEFPVDQVLDYLGIGFGPSNLALAIAVEEANAMLPASISGIFLDSKAEFGWHSDMLMPNATMQVSFLKDLVTLRNPQSRYTFLNYLKHKERLDQFVNLAEVFPLRVEFNDYLCWVAAQFTKQTMYDAVVETIAPVRDGQEGTVEYLRIEARCGGHPYVFHARSVVLAPGGFPQLPPGVVCGARIIHSSHFLSQLQETFSEQEREYRFIVVGAGQSAAEIIEYLLDNYPQATVVSMLREFALRPMDDSKFANQIFFPEQTDLFYNAAPRFRRELLRKYANANDSVVDIGLIEKLYRRQYLDEVNGGKRRLVIEPFCELTGANEREQRVYLELNDLQTGKCKQLDADAAILATGYERHINHPLLADIDEYLAKDNIGNYLISRDYQLQTTANFHAAVFIQGLCKETHGISDTLLSLLAYRSQEITEALQRHIQRRSSHAHQQARSQ